jgi:signal transduction protein with GAF and PtsI domain
MKWDLFTFLKRINCCILKLKLSLAGEKNSTSITNFTKANSHQNFTFVKNIKKRKTITFFITPLERRFKRQVFRILNVIVVEEKKTSVHKIEKRKNAERIVMHRGNDIADGITSKVKRAAEYCSKNGKRSV